jgi:hypothetical protein
MMAADDDDPFQKPFKSACCKLLILHLPERRKKTFQKHLIVEGREREVDRTSAGWIIDRIGRVFGVRLSRHLLKRVQQELAILFAGLAHQSAELA